MFGQRTTVKDDKSNYTDFQEIQAQKMVRELIQNEKTIIKERMDEKLKQKNRIKKYGYRKFFSSNT